jgi:hypothetical protein
LCCDYDIIVLCETWLNCTIYDSELFCDRYVVYRRDRETSGFHQYKSGGGVLIAVSKKISSRRLPHLESKCEELWVELNIPKKKQPNDIILLCSLYLPPPIQRHILDSFIDNANSILESNTKTIILGDFNLSKIIWDDKENITNMTPSILESSLLDFLALNNLTQHNRVFNDTNKILDLVISNVSNLEVGRSRFILSTLDSYHPPLEFEIASCSSKNLLPYNPKNKNNFYKADYNKISSYLSSIPWESSLGSCKSVDEMTDIFYSELSKSILKFVPKSKPPSKKYPIWYTKNLIRLLREKYKLRLKYKKYKNPLDELALHTIKKRCSDLIESCYSIYITDLEKDLSVNPKKFWTFLKNKKLNNNLYPSAMKHGDLEETTGTGICNLFATFFASVYKPSLPTANLPFPESHGSISIGGITLCQDDVLKALKNLDYKKGAGPDGIPPLFAFQCRNSLSLPLTIIFNMSLHSGVFPRIWKDAKIVPVFKSGDTSSVLNYRPISILSVFGKVFESLICPIISFHIKQLISNNQSGFIASRSTATNLIPFTHFISKSLDSRIPVDTIYTDFSKAFDTVDHEVLRRKLLQFGIFGTLLDWFSSYLSQRKLKVVINGFSSEPFESTSGVPQGSHLGPIIFNIFISDISSIFKSASCFLYADDMKLTMQIRDVSDISLLQDDLDRLSEWCNANKLYLNVEKCKYMQFLRGKSSCSANYTINDQILQEVTTIRDLGVILDKKLRFHKHIDNVATKGFQMLGFVLRNAKQFKRTSTKILLYKLLVRSGLEYCSQVWSPQYDVYIQRIERIQKRFLWHLSYQNNKAKQLPSYKDRLNYFRLSSLRERRLLLDQTFLYKIINGAVECPELLRLINLNVPHKLPRRVRYIPFSETGSKSNLGHHATMNRLQRQHNQLHKDCDIDIFCDTLGRFKRKIINAFSEVPV